MIADDQWGHRRPVALLDIGDNDVPTDRAILCIQRNKMGVRCEVVKPPLVHRHSAMADMQSFVDRLIIVPEHMPGTGVNGPYIIGDGEVEHAVNEQRRRLDRSILICLEGPRQSERSDILRG